MEIAQPPLAIKDKVASRIKVISRLDISEKRVPQDGRMKLVLSKSKTIDFRVSTLPTLYGEKIVMRILDSAGVKLGIEALGYEPDQQQAMMSAIARPYGMILVTGPTGSGKTVSLYTCLNILNQPGVNISTAEDPAEIQLAGVNQVNVNDKAGLTFAAALKAFLRQDPDIIMVGEIRDLETADIAIKAAQTGHLVLSTLHTNDAPTTLQRLLNMGVAPFNIASSVILITAQRLGRRLCAQCKKPKDIPPEALLRAGFSEEDIDGSWQPYGPIGCDHCKGTGYKGRVGIYQVMPISDEMRQVIMRNGNAIEIADQAQQGRRPRPAAVRAAQGEGGHHVARGNRGDHQRVTRQPSHEDNEPWPQQLPPSSAATSRNTRSSGRASTATTARCAASRRRPPRPSSRPTCAARASASSRSAGRRSAAAARSTRRTSRSSRASSRRC